MDAQVHGTWQRVIRSNRCGLVRQTVYPREILTRILSFQDQIHSCTVVYRTKYTINCKFSPGSGARPVHPRGYPGWIVKKKKNASGVPLGFSLVYLGIHYISLIFLCHEQLPGYMPSCPWLFAVYTPFCLKKVSTLWKGFEYPEPCLHFREEGVWYSIV